MKDCLLWLGLLLLAGCASTAGAREVSTTASRPAGPAQAPAEPERAAAAPAKTGEETTRGGLAETIAAAPVLAPETVEISVDAGEAVLAGYVVAIRWDPRIAAIWEFESAGAAGFEEPPASNPAAYQKGFARIAAVQTSREGPRGLVRVARIRFVPVSEGTTGVTATLEDAVGPDGERLAARVMLSSAEIRVGR